MSAPCCACEQSSNRCSNEECACFISQKPCQVTCETSHLAADCLNRPLSRCSCLPNSAAGNQPHGKPTKNDPKSGYCNCSHCECYRLREPCTKQCGCVGGPACGHTAAALNLYNKPKQQKKEKGCKCSSGKKGCSKAKCPCKQQLMHCSLSCKCQSECSNATALSLSKGTRACFMDPGQDTCAMVVRLVGRNYFCQLEFLNTDKNLVHAPEQFYETLLNVAATYKLNLDAVQIYASRSPCFHQDCEPRCDVMQRCESQKACARLMAVSYGQLKRHMASCHVQMSLKFLMPYVKRGDLYTQQGIIALMEAGITVEPLVMKEWAKLVAEPGVPMSLPINHWTNCQMDRLVRESQHYVNACRRALGEGQTLWISAFHDILKNTALVSASGYRNMENILKRLQKQGDQEAALAKLKAPSDTKFNQVDQRSSAVMTGSTESTNLAGNLILLNLDGPDINTVEDGLSFFRKSDATQSQENLQLQPPSLTTSRTMESLSYSPGKPAKKSKKIKRSSTVTLTHILPSPEKKASGKNEKKTKSKETKATPEASEPLYAEDTDLTPTAGEFGFTNRPRRSTLVPSASKLATLDSLEQTIMNISGRPITSEERAEIRLELHNTVDSIREQLGGLLQFLEHKTFSTAV